MTIQRHIFLYASLSFLFSIFVVVPRAQAYPDFIGFGYASCLTCHFNGQGHGALNDYGRALWAGEIASRGFASASTTDEQLAEKSGFLGKTPLPWWIRPAIKYRSIYIKRNYGSPQAVEKNYFMQADFNVVLRSDPDERFIFYFTEGYRPNSSSDPSRNLDRWMAREYWGRLKLGETYWLYAGLMDKVFGLRNVDHTSYTRTFQRLNQYDQSLGVTAHKIEDKWELTGNYFTGNPDELKATRQNGYSLMFDREIGEKKRVSLSYLSSKSDADKYGLYALSYRAGLTKGSSWMFEYGLRQYEVLLAPPSKTGSWAAVHSLIQITRGYHFQSSIERYNEEFKPSSSDRWRWTLGLVAFPAPRYELRAGFVTRREINEVGARDDNWSLQGQLHVSL